MRTPHFFLSAFSRCLLLVAAVASSACKQETPISNEEAFNELSFRFPLAVGNEWVYSFKEQRRFGRTGMPNGPLLEGTFTIRITDKWRANDTTILYSYRAIRQFSGAYAGLSDTVMSIPELKPSYTGISYWYGGIQARKSEIRFPLDNLPIRKYEVFVSTTIDRNRPFDTWPGQTSGYKFYRDTLSMGSIAGGIRNFPYNAGFVTEAARTNVVHNVGVVYIRGDYSVGSTLTSGEWFLLSYKLQP
jgi:hypothetical protein